jgi:hypothetical protein
VKTFLSLGEKKRRKRPKVFKCKKIHYRFDLGFRTEVVGNQRVVWFPWHKLKLKMKHLISMTSVLAWYCNYLIQEALKNQILQGESLNNTT